MTRQATVTAITQEAAPADDAEVRLSRKATRTRESLIHAARTVFSRDRFLDARISDIAREAGVAHGSFYTYFDSKESIFREVMSRLNREMRIDPTDLHWASDDPAESVEHANRLYIDAYRANAALIATLDQVVTFNEEIRELRKEFRRPFLERNVRAIRRWQGAGIADPDLDPLYAASALQAMVERFMYIWVVLEQDFDEERAVATLSRMWLLALGISPAPAKKAGRAQTAGGKRGTRPAPVRTARGAR
ncbi:MAG: TetR/AcrR family transcriptional regulator [Acidimicrobiales bacterium]